MALKRTTIKEVARAAGVSTQTVSRVINDRPDVAPETRQRVLEVIAHLGFQPSALARSLIQQRSLTIGIVTAGLKYTGPSYTLHGITEQAEQSGYALLLKELLHFDSIAVEPILRDIVARQVDGIIWAVPEAGANRNWLADLLPTLPVPIVFLTMHEAPGVTVVATDNYLGGRLATEHLIAQGRRRIGHIAGPLVWWEASQRAAGWKDALAAAGLQATDARRAEGDWSSASGERAFHQLLAQFPEMDAVFVANDQMALSVLLVASRVGRRVPEDLSVVGFDAIPESAYFTPPLTTIQQDPKELGRTAVRQIVAMIEAGRGSNAPYRHETIWLRPQLIIRESSAAGRA
jgi:LacI family transcriptional regulator